MNASTGEFLALTGQAAGYAELSERVDGLTDLLEDQVVPLIRAVAWLTLADGPVPVRPEPARRAAPRPRRHLHLVRADAK